MVVAISSNLGLSLLMKRAAVACLFLIVLVSWTGGAAATDCSSNSYTLTTQAEVDALGATGCGSVSGYLQIRDSADITNLDALSNLASVGGDLIISGNRLLTNLDGLTNLASVGGSLLLGGNALTNVNGLAKLSSIVGDLEVVDNPLTNLDGLANITSVGGFFAMDFLPAITNLDALSNLTHVFRLTISNMDALTNLDGLANLSNVGGYLFIGFNRSLKNLDGLANLSSIGEALVIRDNEALTRLDGLARITSVGGDLSIFDNQVLARCESVALLLGWPDGPPNDNVAEDITISNNGIGCNSIAEVLSSYNPPSISRRFNGLLQAVQDVRGSGGDKQAQAAGDSSADAGVARQLAKEEGATAQAKAMNTFGEPAAIPAMSHYLMLMMVGLVSLFGLRRLRV